MSHVFHSAIFLCTFLGCCITRIAPVLADGPTDNNPKLVRQIPPMGIAVDADRQMQLMDRVRAIEERLDAFDHKSSIELEMVAVFPRAVRITFETNMFYSEKELEQAKQLLDEAERRLEVLQSNDKISPDLLGALTTPLESPQAVAAGFRSKIDGSIQPYGLVLPANWTSDETRKYRLDIWLHGRAEKTSEVAFLHQRMNDLGQYTPDDTIVLHPFGRYSNAFKFAGEIDVLEAIEHVLSYMSIDDSRITVRGFSMGGAGCWQLAVHYPNLWAAANPGAGFSETTEFLQVFQSEQIDPTWYQQDLLQWYDCPGWANNLRQVPTVAYSGEIDRQKQAADVMEAALAERGMRLTHVVGPATAHKIHADSKIIVEEFLQSALQSGKAQIPQKIDLTTFMLRYHQLGWLSIEGLDRHWRESRVQGELREKSIVLTTTNITRLKITPEPNTGLDWTRISALDVDGQTLAIDARSLTPLTELELERSSGEEWNLVTPGAAKGLRKRPGLQGPIDDAFMDTFSFVPPDKLVAATPADQWIAQEYAHATSQWRIHFRGDVRQVSASEIARAVGDVGGSHERLLDQNLILFGDPRSNSAIGSLLSRLPIQWSDRELSVAGTVYASDRFMPVLIFPNPIYPSRYIVLNSGFTFREYAYLNNARQVPMLPDWAVVDVSSGVTSQLPGRIVDAGFFNEQWQFD